MVNTGLALATLEFLNQFDFSVDENDKVRLMEVNTLIIGVINQQMNSGPLLQEFTDEVIEYCEAHKKSVVLDFYV